MAATESAAGATAEMEGIKNGDEKMNEREDKKDKDQSGKEDGKKNAKEDAKEDGKEDGKVEDEDEDDEDDLKGGELLFCGCASWENIGRKAVDPSQNVNLMSPTRLSTLQNIDIVFVASGSASAHCVALDVNGRCYTWGRNERGQLGHGDLLQRTTPTLVTALTRQMVVKAGAGRSHTAVVTEDGASLAFGWNKHGQLGSGNLKEENEKLPVRCLVTEVKQVVCGAEFTVWLSALSGSSILSAGCPQYGQLGHGTDNEYNAKEGSVRLVYEPQPRPRAIAPLAGKKITKVACGNNHSLAVDSDGFIYTWGFGGHGRLGHKEQKDEWVPRVVDIFQRTNTLPPSAIIAAGSSYSGCTAGGGQLYMWGRVKPTGDNWMYPKPVFDLSGWNIRSMDCGNTSSFAAADASCISWGTATYGELGYGASGPKSSASPKLVDVLEGMHVLSVACGMGHSLIVVDRSKMPEKLEKLEVYSGHEAQQPAAEEEDAKPTKAAKGKPKAGNKRKAMSSPAAAGAKKGKGGKKAAAAAAEETEEESEELDEPAKGRGRGKAAGRGRGRGKSSSSGSRPPSKGSSAGKQAPVEEPAAKRGRGRPSGKGQPKAAAAAETGGGSASKRGRGRGRKGK